MNILPPSPYDIAKQHADTIVGVATTFCRTEFQSPDVTAVLLADHSDRVGEEVNHFAFLLRHTFGFVGVFARLNDDGTLTAFECKKV